MANGKSNGKRIYICHTFYHVYVSILKECHLQHVQKDAYCRADIILSTVYLDLTLIRDRLQKTEFFDHIYIYHEKPFEAFPHLMKYKEDHGILRNMVQRMIFCKKFSKTQEDLIPVDLKPYDGNIWVYCDSDPIGYYLNGHHIHYHAVEDGLDCLRYADGARYDNQGAFGLKQWMASHNLIFMQDGHSKYCIDMEVNNLAVLDIQAHKYVKYVEVCRQSLVDELTRADKDVILNCFIGNIERIRDVMKDTSGRKRVLILTEHLCTEEQRYRMFRDLMDEYCVGCTVMIKPHPKDDLDYAARFADAIVMDRHFPMEIMEYIEGIHFDTVYAILTNLRDSHFADQMVNLGTEYLNRYAEPGQYDFVQNI